MPNSLPAPIITEHAGIRVVRDDLLPGGTKRRAVHLLFEEGIEEYVYASPVWGYAQVALAYAARDYGKKATIFCAKHKHRKPLTQEAADAGAQIIEEPVGYLGVVQARARAYCAQRPLSAKLLPFGLKDARMAAGLADVARSLRIQPEEVWTVCGSGVLSCALQEAWPQARFYGVRIGAEVEAGRAHIFAAPEKYEKAATIPPPFPSCGNYDAKAWRYIMAHAVPGALFWNVAK